MRSTTLLGSAATALALTALAATPAAADVNSPTTRDCSLFAPAVPAIGFAGLDPDFLELGGVSSDPSGVVTQTAAATPVTLKASESPDAGDNQGHVTLDVTVTAPGTASQALSGAGTGQVVLALPLGGAPGTTYTISWKATFDNGFHACPGPMTPANLQPSPFVVRSA